MGGPRAGSAPRRPIALAFLFLAGACGYRFSAAGGPLPRGVTAVYVPILHNRTTEAGLEAVLTEELRSELERTGHGGSPSSEARLEGILETVGSAPLALKTEPLPTPAIGPHLYAPSNPGLYQVAATVTVRLVRGAELVTQIEHLTLNEPYLPADDLATNEANRRLALRRLARALAKEIVDRLTAG